jgi:hypothetical protein
MKGLQNYDKLKHSAKTGAWEKKCMHMPFEPTQFDHNWYIIKYKLCEICMLVLCISGIIITLKFIDF